MTRHMLYSGEMNHLMQNHFAQKECWKEKTIKFTINPEVEFDVSYFYNSEKNAVVIPTPLAVKPVTAADFSEPTYEETIAAIASDLNCMNFSVSASLIGKGGSERHYIAFHRDHEGNMALFDSLLCDPERFLNSAAPPNMLEIVWGYFTAFFRFIQFQLGFGRVVHSTFFGQDIAVHRLATQPAWDGVSCGYHSGGAVLAMSDDIEKNTSSSLESITNAIKDNKQLDLTAEQLLNQTPNAQMETVTISPALSTFAKTTPPVNQSNTSAKVPADNLNIHPQLLASVIVSPVKSKLV